MYHLDNLRDVDLSGSSLVIWLIELKFIMNLVLIVFAYLCCRSMVRATVPLNFNAFLEKAKLKDDGSNYTDWVRNLRIILIAAQKNYVLDAPPGNPPATAKLDIVNAWQMWTDDYLIVQCAMLYGLEPGLQKRFEHHRACIWDIPRVEVDISS